MFKMNVSILFRLSSNGVVPLVILGSLFCFIAGASHQACVPTRLECSQIKLSICDLFVTFLFWGVALIEAHIEFEFPVVIKFHRLKDRTSLQFENLFFLTYPRTQMHKLHKHLGDFGLTEADFAQFKVCCHYFLFVIPQ